jgi:hypothetical protein
MLQRSAELKIKDSRFFSTPPPMVLSLSALAPVPVSGQGPGKDPHCTEGDPDTRS